MFQVHGVLQDSQSSCIYLRDIADATNFEILINTKPRSTQAKMENLAKTPSSGISNAQAINWKAFHAIARLDFAYTSTTSQNEQKSLEELFYRCTATETLETRVIIILISSRRRRIIAGRILSSNDRGGLRPRRSQLGNETVNFKRDCAATYKRVFMARQAHHASCIALKQTAALEGKHYKKNVGIFATDTEFHIASRIVKLHGFYTDAA